LSDYPAVSPCSCALPRPRRCSATDYYASDHPRGLDLKDPKFDIIYAPVYEDVILDDLPAAFKTSGTAA